jgi:hypothetical protein
MTKKKYSPEQLRKMKEKSRERAREKMQKSMAMLEEGVVALADSDRWQQYLKFQSKFHRYSFLNTLLILFQKPGATCVAGYTKWNELGRYVKAGEKGIAIMVPYGRKKKSESDEKQAAELDGIGLDDGSQNPDHQSAGQATVFFGTGYVYDVSQTEGREIPEVLTLLTGEDKLALNELVDQVITARGYQVKVVDREAAYGANGVCQWKEKVILIADDLSPLHRVKTRVHELAHSMMHTEEEYRLHTEKSVLELEAESVAYVVLNHFGMDASDYSFGYLATWQGGDKERVISAFKASGKRIQEAAEEIINGIENLLGNDTTNAEDGEAVWIELPAAMALDEEI